MSQSESPALGSRENFFGDGDYDTSSDDPARGHVEKPTDGKTGRIARWILASGADVLCPVCIDNDRSVILPAPSEYVPKTVETEYGTLDLHVCPTPKRACPCCGTLVFGGVIADRPTAEFLRIVEEVLEATGGVPSARQSDLLGHARSRKQRGWSDKANLSRVVSDLLHR